MNFKHEIRWLEGDVPYSERFEDTYYARDNGREESETVFLWGNGLPGRWRDCSAFTVGELGFGTGLNCALTLQSCLNEAPSATRLTYISYEQFPLSAENMQISLSPWPDLAELMKPVTNNWSTQDKLLDIRIENVQILIYFDDVNTSIHDLDREVDAWYLDGFAPARNSEMWNSQLLAKIYQKTSPGGTFSTFTAAGWVRRNLQAAGFVVERVKGYGRKRERLQGYKQVN